MEVLYDLDTEAPSNWRDELGMKMVRAATVGTHPAFVRMIRQLIAERVLPNEPKLAMGSFGLITTFVRRIAVLLRSEPVDLSFRQPRLVSQQP